MSTTVQFTPSATQVFSFQPVLAGTNYSATIQWSVFGQRWYLNLMDATGASVLFTALVGSGPRLQAALSWSGPPNLATATTTVPHNVPVGQLANIWVSQTDSPFDGGWQALSTSPTTLTYALDNPLEALPLNGVLSFPLNLVAGVVAGGWLLFHWDTQQLEYSG